MEQRSKKENIIWIIICVLLMTFICCEAANLNNNPEATQQMDNFLNNIKQNGLGGPR